MPDAEQPYGEITVGLLLLKPAGDHHGVLPLLGTVTRSTFADQKRRWCRGVGRCVEQQTFMRESLCVRLCMMQTISAAALTGAAGRRPWRASTTLRHHSFIDLLIDTVTTPVELSRCAAAFVRAPGHIRAGLHHARSCIY